VLDIAFERQLATERTVDIANITAVPFGFGDTYGVFLKQCSLLGVNCITEPAQDDIIETMEASGDAETRVLVAYMMEPRQEAQLTNLLAKVEAEGLPIVVVGQAGLDRHNAITSVPHWEDLPRLARAFQIAQLFSAARSVRTAKIRRINRELSVLVAEDNETNQAVIRMTLEKAGHKAVIVDNGQSALDQLNDEKFDICIPDMHMSEMSGIEVTQLCRFSPEHRELPIVLVTADTSQTARTEAKNAGVTQFLGKPIRPAELVDVLYDILGIDPQETAPEERQRPARAKRPHLHTVDGGPILEERVLQELSELASDGAFMNNLLEGFLADAQETCTQLDVALEERDYEATGATAHALMGAARAVGASAVAARATAINRAEPLRISRDGPRLLGLLHEDLQNTEQVFREYLGNQNQASSEISS